MKGIEIKDQNKVNARLENLIKARAIVKYYFKSDEGNGIYRIYCLDKAGKYLLNSREIRSDWVQTNNTKPVHLIKKRLAILQNKANLNDLNKQKEEEKRLDIANREKAMNLKNKLNTIKTNCSFKTK